MRRDVFQAIADPIRRDIIELISQEALTVSSIAKKFEISRPAISKHLKILSECGIIKIEARGRERLCFIEPKNLIPAFLWIDQYRHLWEEKLDRFEQYLANLQEEKKNND